MIANQENEQVYYLFTKKDSDTCKYLLQQKILKRRNFYLSMNMYLSNIILFLLRLLKTSFHTHDLYLGMVIKNFLNKETYILLNTQQKNETWSVYYKKLFIFIIYRSFTFLKEFIDKSKLVLSIIPFILKYKKKNKWYFQKRISIQHLCISKSILCVRTVHTTM